MKKRIIWVLTILAAMMLLCATAAAEDQPVYSSTTEWTDGNTYVVSGHVTISSRVKVTGNVTLHLLAGGELKCENGISVLPENTLTINGSGTLIADASEHANAAGIGGGFDDGHRSAGTIIINGGTITAIGGSYGAGIGGGMYGHSGTITINGGYVTAIAGSCGAGIGGGGNDYWAGNYGNCGNITINGGTVNATGNYTGAGIGGGGGSKRANTVHGGSGGTIVINGGKVTATGGTEGAGIGHGDSADPGTVTLGWTNQTDFILASSYTNTISFAAGKWFRLENGQTPIGTDQISGQKIVPYIAHAYYNVEISSSLENGTVIAVPDMAEEGKTVQLIITPDADFEVDSLSVTGPDGEIPVTNTLQFTMPAGDVTVNASFRRVNHAITIAAAEHGSVTAEPAVAHAGQTVTLMAAPEDGYELDSLTVTGPDGGITVTDGQFTMPGGDVTVSAAFRQCSSYTVTVTPVTEGGRVVAYPETAMRGETISLYINPKAYWTLDSVTVTGPEGEVAVTDNKFTMPAGNVTVTAVFRNTPGKYGQTNLKLISGTGENPGNLFVTSSERWSGSGMNSYEVEFQSKHYIIPTAYVMRLDIMAEGSPNRVPTDWTLQARRTLNDEWTTLASVSGDTTMAPVNYAAYTFPLDNSAEYRYFRLRITGVKSGNKMELSGFWFMTGSAVNIPEAVITQRYGSSRVTKTYTFEESFTLGRTAFTEDGKYLDSWNSQQDGNGTAYGPDELLTATEDAEYWAILLPREQHSIQVNVTGPGTVTVDETAWSGDAVPISWASNEGAVLVGVTVTGPDGSEIPVNNGSFYMPGGDVTVDAVFREHDFAVTTEGDTSYTYEDGVLTIGGTGRYYISMRDGVETTSNRIVICDAPEIHLSNVSIDVSGTALPAVTREDSFDSAVLYVSGTNVLRAGTGKCGLNMRSFYLRSDDDGALYAYGGEGATGIPGIMTIESGTLYAYGGEGADGTGANVNVNGGKLAAWGVNGVGESLTVRNDGQVEAHGAANGCGIRAKAIITGGTVTAEGGDGIGANCTISGGTVTATGSSGSGIGANCAITGSSTITATGGSYGVGPDCTITSWCDLTAKGVNGGDGFGDGLTIDAGPNTIEVLGWGRYGAAGSVDIINGNVELLGSVQALQSGTITFHGGYRSNTISAGSGVTSTQTNGYPSGSTVQVTDKYVFAASRQQTPQIVFSDEARNHILTIEIDRHDGYGWQRYYKPNPDGYGALTNFKLLDAGDSYRMNFDIPVKVNPTGDPDPACVASTHEDGTFTETWTLKLGEMLYVEADYGDCATVTYQDDDGSVMKTVYYYKGDTANIWRPASGGNRNFTGWTQDGEAVEDSTMTVTEDITLTAVWTYKLYHDITAVNCVVRDEDGNALTSAYEGQRLYVNLEDITVPDGKYCTGFTINGELCYFGPRYYMPTQAITVAPVFMDGVTVTIDLRDGKTFRISEEESGDEKYGSLWELLYRGDYFLNYSYGEGETEIVTYDLNGDYYEDIIEVYDYSDGSVTYSAGEGAILIDSDVVLRNDESPYTFIFKLGARGFYDFILPEGTKRIDAYAFQGIAARAVYVPDGCTTIGEYAFSGCPNLRLIRLPKDCTFDETTFSECAEGFTIVAPTGGTAERLADEYLIEFKKIRGERIPDSGFIIQN